MANNLKILVPQLNFIVGDISYNKNRIISAIKEANERNDIDLLLFPELCLTGYPPEDLLLRDDFHKAVNLAIEEIVAEVNELKVIISFPHRIKAGEIYNSAGLIENGKLVKIYNKQLLPNYSVFDEKRYFTAGSEPCIFDLKGIPTAITICEDVWFPGPSKQATDAGAKFIVSLNASPFGYEKDAERRGILRDRAQENNVPILYAHSVGAIDEIVFDGGSMLVNSNGVACQQAPFFEESMHEFELEINDGSIVVPEKPLPKIVSIEERIYKALVLGTRQYVHDSGFEKVLIGISGGIDSALVLAIAVDAFGAENVEGVIMPSRHTSEMSVPLGKKLCENFGVNYHEISIENPYQSFLDTLSPIFHDTEFCVTEENIQARTRQILLMALSNKFNKMVLTTGNKSEMAVGYATLYGDMAGGYAPIKDVLKTMVYRLSIYRNTISDLDIIPEEIIKREPSAELSPNQKDQDTLPPYDVLDGILERLVVQDKTLDEIVADGYQPELVKRVIKMVAVNEYKRRQAAPGPRVSNKAFGRGRRYPSISKYIGFMLEG